MGGTDEKTRAVLRVFEAVTQFQDREHLFTAIASVLRPHFPFDSLIVVLDGPGPDQFTPYFIHPRLAVPALQRSRSALLEVFEKGKPVYVRSREQVASLPTSLEAMEKFGAHSYVALPLSIHDRVFAVLLLSSSRSNTYDGIDMDFASHVAMGIAVALDNCLAYERIALSSEQLVEENQLMRAALSAHTHGEMVTESAAMREVRRLVDLVAPTDAAVLIGGETGAGKERLARLIHECSLRADRPLLALNCAAMPSSLVESELFGHEAGAFTGANRRRRGRFELADGGTLLLDEVGELAHDAQGKLLRVLQTGEFERLGGNETLRVDVRLIAATNRSLEQMVEAKTFRADLFYRLSVFPIELPPLWARREDLPALARQFVNEAAARLGILPPHLDEQAIRDLRSYSWPGNVRELQNVIERAVILSRGGVLDVASLLEAPASQPVVSRAEPSPGVAAETAEVRTALEAASWTIEGEGGAAARLGLRPSTLRSRMRRLGIERPR